MLSRIKTYLAREKGIGKDEMAALARLGADERLERLSGLMYDICAKPAARFVEDERRRGDSPFSGLPGSDLFHEVLVMNFWILERHFKGTQRPLMERLYRHYGTAFPPGRQVTADLLKSALLTRFQAYDESWDEVSGHQDVFARRALGIMFGERQIAAAPQAAFWLISHADRTMKRFADVKLSVERLLGGGNSGAGPSPRC